MQKTIALIFGGEGAERRISERSAANVIEKIQGKLDFITIGIDALGSWFLFDGVKDTWAWQENGDWEKFDALDLSRISPVIQKVTVSGWHLEGMTLKLRTDGDWELPPIKARRQTEFSATFVLESPRQAQGLRLEFPARNVEMYEIEVF